MDNNRFLRIRTGLLCMLTLACLPSVSRAALTWEGCSALQPSDFQMVRLVGKSATNSPLAVDETMEEPIKLAFDADAAGNVDVYWVERYGAVKRYSTSTRKVALVGELTPGTQNEDGLVGIALDPGFKANQWIWLFYSYQTAFRVSRFTLKDKLLDKATEVVVLAIPSDRNKIHTGGAMTFDGYGDLWITVGDNAAGNKGAANTDDLRGGVLRIHPTADGKYTIPAGNMRDALKGSYTEAELLKVKPEVYVKGTRNAYTIAVDPVRRWLAWGDVGPDWYETNDNAHPTEEHNLVKAPGFMGWPLFSGPNLCNGACAQDPKAPTVTGLTGLSKLPPAVAPIHDYPRSAAMTGPIYRYDGDSPSKIKLPPHFHRKWFLSDFRSMFVATTLSEDGTRILAADTVFKNLTQYGGTTSNSIVDVQQGPDGALYIINYNGWYNTVASTNIARIEYKGACLPAEPKLETIAGVGIDRSRAQSRLEGVAVEGLAISISSPGSHRIALTDLAGKEVFSRSGSGKADYRLPPEAPGMRILKVRTASGTLVKPVYHP